MTGSADPSVPSDETSTPGPSGDTGSVGGPRSAADVEPGHSNGSAIDPGDPDAPASDRTGPSGDAGGFKWVAVLPAVVALIALVVVVVVAVRPQGPDQTGSGDTSEATPPDPNAAPVVITSSAPRYGTLPQLVSASGLIVEAEVVDSTEGRWFGDPETSGGSGRILSRLVTLQVSRVLAGPTPLENRVLVEEEGWTEDGAPVAVDGLGPAAVGDRGFWFLTPGGDPDVGAYLVVNFQGRYLIRGSKLEGASASGTNAADAYGFELIAQVEDMSPEEFVSAVASSTMSSTVGAHVLDEPAPASPTSGGPGE